MIHISRFIIADLMRNKMLLGYFIFLSLIGWGIFLVESQPEKAHLILLQVTLFLVPIFSMIFSGIYFYNAKEFIILLLSQPVHRKTIFNSLYMAITCSFSATYLFCVGIPLILFYNDPSSYLLILMGILLTIIFSGVALFIGVHIQDKSKGLGIVILLWSFFAFIFDGLLLFFMYQFGDYPIERMVIFLSLLNPIDTARIAVIMKTDISAMMGLSGAVFQKIFGSTLGMLFAIVDMIMWSIFPFLWASRKFGTKDF